MIEDGKAGMDGAYLYELFRGVSRLSNGRRLALTKRCVSFGLRYVTTRLYPNGPTKGAGLVFLVYRGVIGVLFSGGV